MSTVQRIGNYRVLRRIAVGGMAEVFLARSEGLGGFQKTLVIKRILPHLAADPQFVTMFLNEARVASQLDHPNVVTIYELGEADSWLYLVMEYIDGPSLRVLLRRVAEAETPIPVGLAVSIMSHAAEGLQYAHDAVGVDGQPLELIHRDVSPDNILLSRQGAVKVVDFGIVQAANLPHLTKSGLIRGKVSYMPPEQLQKLPLDRRTDVFALGVCLYEILAGVRPFEDTSEVAMIQAILNDPPAPLRTVRPDVDVELETIILGALEKDRDRRFASCRAFQQELDGYLMRQGLTPTGRDLATLVEGLLGPPVPATPTSAIPPPQPAPSAELEPATPTGPEERSTESGERDAISAGVTAVDRRRRPTSAARLPAKVRAGAGAVAAVIGALAGYVYMKPHSVARAEGVPILEVSPGSPRPIPSPTAPDRVPPPSPVALPTALPAVSAPPIPVQAAGAIVEGRQEPIADVGAPHPSEGRHQASRQSVQPVTTSVLPSLDPALSQVGQADFRIRPWANVEIDHQAFGQTPLAPISLGVGSHHVVLTNTDLKVRDEMDITIVRGETVVVKKRLISP